LLPWPRLQLRQGSEKRLPVQGWELLASVKVQQQQLLWMSVKICWTCWGGLVLGVLRLGLELVLELGLGLELVSGQRLELELG
jgi:hypothetical protein